MAICVILGLGLTACSGGTDSAAAEKIKVESLDDIPRYSYPIEGSATELLQSDEKFAAFAAEVRADVEGLLERYDIQDDATLQGLYGTLLRLDFLNGDYEGALEWLEKSRALEDKESNRLMAGLTLKSWVAAHREVGEHPAEADFNGAFASHLDAAVAVLPWDVVQDSIEESKGRAEILSDNLIVGIAQSEIDPVVAKTGEISSDLARRLVGMRYTMKMFLPVRDEAAAVYQRVIDANRIEKPDIWAARQVTLEQGDDLEPVVVAIWDSGVDTGVFGGGLWTNPNERLDGSDTDGNGYVDDVHGVAYDYQGHKSPDLLFPAGDMAGKVDDAMKYSKAFMDVTASIDSAEASELKGYMGGLEPAEVRGFIESLQFAALYMHGTHVAGIALEGNPFARALVARISFDYHLPPGVQTVETATRHAQSYMDTVQYFKDAGARVANMSWGWTLKEVEGILEANGVGETAEERTEMTREIFGILEQGLYDAIASAPEILFITAAGNDDNNVEFDEVIPSNFDLPNLMTVAAVDQAGDPTSFTSGGRNVVVYTNGFEVESYVPGGDRVAASGTSMASPNAVNLAAKLFALDPDLSPGEVIDLIKRGATPREGDTSMLLVHPQRSVELLREAASHSG
jgi:subtilisin family serine protease